MITVNTLKLLNSTALTAMSNVMTTELGMLSRRASNARARLMRLTGQHQQFTGSMNRRLFLSPHSGLKSAESSDNTLASVKTSIDTMSMLLNAGAEVFRSGKPESQDLSDDIRNARDELYRLFPQPASLTKVYGTNKLRRIYNSYVRILENIAILESQLDLIHDILKNRATGLEKEPKLNYDVLFSGNLTTLQETTIQKYSDLVEKSVIRPYKKNKVFREAVAAQLRDSDPSERPASKFDLVYGPPISTDGKFVLSEDGLYYDSRRGGIPFSELAPMTANSWKLDYAPWLGGRGKAVSVDDFKRLTDTVFSDDFQYEDPDGTVATLEEIDEVLQAYYRDRNIHVKQTEDEIVKLEKSGFKMESATILNYRRSEVANSAAYEEKIKRRKKQLQLFGLFGDIEITDKDHPLGKDVIIQRIGRVQIKHELATRGYKTDGSDVPFDPRKDTIIRVDDLAIDRPSTGIRVRKILRRAPLNDFSYLKGTGAIPNLKQQERIVIAEDVQSIVAAEEPIYVKGNPFIDTVYLKEFNVDDISTGDFVKLTSQGVSGTGTYIKSIGDSLVTNNLVVCYNFLTPEIVAPKSREYLLDNYAEGSTELNGKLVASSTDHAFPSGLSIPFLRGVVYDPEDSYGIFYRPIDNNDVNNNKGGCYVRLPNNIKDGELYPPADRLNSLTYGEKGFSFDFWTHIPEVSSGLTAPHRYRVVAACENSGKGAEDLTTNITAKVPSDDPGKVLGLVMGFRDKDVSGTATAGADAASSLGQLEFVVLPTVGQNPPPPKANETDKPWSHSIAIKETDIKDAADTSITLNAPWFGGQPTSGTELGMIVPVSVSTVDGKSCSSCDSEFSHYAVTFDYETDSVTVFLDGKVLSSSSISAAFDLPEKQGLNVPTPIHKGLGGLDNKGNSYWSPDSKMEDIKEGMPNFPLAPIFTPWILGGGYSDMIGRDSVMGIRTPLGFLGANANDQYKQYTGSVLSEDAWGGVLGQHIPSLGGQSATGSSRKIPRSGLDGFLGSFKIYSKPLNTGEVVKNYDAQKAYFKNIETYR